MRELPREDEPPPELLEERLDEPPPELRPGLSSTATILTATTKQSLTVPIQALTIREFDDPEQTSFANDANNKKKIEKEGVFTIKNGVAFFRPVKTGVTGTTDIELLEGLLQGKQQLGDLRPATSPLIIIHSRESGFPGYGTMNVK